MKRATMIVLVGAAASCLSAMFMLAAWYVWSNDTGSGSSSGGGQQGGAAGSSRVTLGGQKGGVGIAASLQRPAVTANCIFSANFVIPNTTGKSSTTGPSISNPFKPGADPGIINVGGVYYMASTTSPFEKSKDLKSWSSAGSVQPSGSFWAPEFFCINKIWYCLYTDGLNGKCQVLKSQRGVEGPYVYSHAIPAANGMDPTLFVDADNKVYLVTSAINAPMIVTEISADLKVLGKSASIVKPLQQPAWNREPVVEAPQILCKVSGGRRMYYCVYSGNGCCKPAGQNYYALGYCTAPSVMGPWTVSPDNPILGDAKSGVGFGHCNFYMANSGALGVVYQRETAGRDLCVSRAWFEGDRLLIEPPNVGVARPSP